MYELDRQVFRRALEELTEDTAENELDQINPCLLEQVCRPALHEKALIPSRIDYSQFTLEEMYDMLGAAQSFYRRRFRLAEMNQGLCGHIAAERSRRAFC